MQSDHLVQSRTMRPPPQTPAQSQDPECEVGRHEQSDGIPRAEAVFSEEEFPKVLPASPVAQNPDEGPHARMRGGHCNLGIARCRRRVGERYYLRAGAH